MPLSLLLVYVWITAYLLLCSVVTIVDHHVSFRVGACMLFLSFAWPLCMFIGAVVGIFSAIFFDAFVPFGLTMGQQLGLCEAEAEAEADADAEADGYRALGSA